MRAATSDIKTRQIKAAETMLSFGQSPNSSPGERLSAEPVHFCTLLKLVEVEGSLNLQRCLDILERDASCDVVKLSAAGRRRC